MAHLSSARYEFGVSNSTMCEWQPEVVETLRALGGEGTLGDVVAITGLFRWEVVTALEELMTSDRAHVRVANSGDIVYHLGERKRWERSLSQWWSMRSPRAAQVAFDRRTLRLLRVREGVLSMAELVEHTGLSLVEAEEEMARLADSYGGVPHPSWDGHIVWAFPELMSSSHGRFKAQEPRPAWVRSEDPMKEARAGRRGVVGRIFNAILHNRFVRFRDRSVLRRYALGHVIQTALAGKGVVSLDRTVRYLQARAGKRYVSRSAVEAALRQLAREFDAPITEVNGELFFGFRNLKRQFLASHVVRREIRLKSIASGRTVFDSADSPLMAGERDLESFDRELAERRRLDADKTHDEAQLAD
jgi:hypothetical protein